ncbi:MAG TPA: Hsp20/alpha crystallin family protein [bacterium]|mgnify:CR=1 FL=1|nr:Hsp20/alpha crystallin family protein [bacterium]
MSIIRWNPGRTLMNLPDEMDRFFGDFGLDFWNSDSVWNPAVDITEKSDSYEVKAELPGMKKDEIKISREDDVLMISGERKSEQDEKKDNYHRIERRYGKFQRSFYLPKNVKANDIKANYKDGVLTVTIPKSEEAKPKEIAVS